MSEKKLSFFQQRAAQKKAEYEAEYGLTNERISVAGEICAILSGAVLPVIAPLPPAVTEELGFTLRSEWDPGGVRVRGVVAFGPLWRRLEVPLVTQPVPYTKQTPTAAPGWTGDSISLTELREHLTRLRQTVYEAEAPVEAPVEASVESSPPKRNCFSCAHSDPEGVECDFLLGDDHDEAVVAWLNGEGGVREDGTPDPESDGCPGHSVLRD